MKKSTILVGLVLACATAFTFVSCEKDDASKGCTCEISYLGVSVTEEFTGDELKAEGIEKCSELANLLEDEGLGASCKAKK